MSVSFAWRLVGLVILSSACSWKEVHVAPTPVPGSASVGSAPLIDHSVKTLKGDTVSLAQYRGKALLIVNTASECGLTPQYEGLQKLYLAYKDRGLEVLGFPCNNRSEEHTSELQSH